MPFRKKSITVNIVTLLFMAMRTYGAPTSEVSDNTALICATCAADNTNTPVVSISDIAPADEAYNNWNLASIANEILKPPTDLTSSSASLPIGTTSLPAVPGAVFMVLTGFLCVSLVKDRRVWIAALAGLLWAGHIGKELFVARSSMLDSRSSPQDASRKGSITEFRQMPDTGFPQSAVLRRVSGIEYPYIKRYTTYETCPERSRGIRHTKYDSLHRMPSGRFSMMLRSHKWNHSTSIEHLVSSIRTTYKATKRLAYINKRHFYFSPAFIFENLARGPPESTG